MSDRKNFSLWLLYDFANSLAFINVSFYFSLWLVTDHGMSDFWISLSVAASTLILIAVLPYLGHLSDRFGKKLFFLRGFTLLAILSLAFMGWLTMKIPFSKEMGFWVLAFYCLFLLFYQACLPFYNAFLHGFARNRSSNAVAGWGLGIGQVGNIAGMLLVLPLVNTGGHDVAFFAAAILFLIFVSPVLLFMKEPTRTESLERQTHYLASLKKAMKVRGLIPFLFSYYFFADAILTLQLFLSLYLQEVAGMNDSQKTIVLIVALICGSIGGFLSHKFARLFTSTQRSLYFLIGSWAILLAIFSFVNSPILFYILIVLNGLAYGTLFALSRAFYSEITPADQQAELFSVYTLFERAASIVGPLLWSSVIFLFADFGPTRYRFAMFSLALMIGISFWIFRGVRKALPSKESF